MAAISAADAALADCSGSVVVLGTVELLRSAAGRAVGDPLATGLGASVAVAVFTVTAQARAVRAGRPNV
ncbi:hypothetical protein C5L38_17630 [Streptomyces sp. WAC00288]|nr:hypothetical protein C5L38_17630 [Streptomyces sp. WAC00288]KYG55298.1 hypothetical protein AWI43_13330 [Streptomyces sp. WAC04657]